MTDNAYKWQDIGDTCKFSETYKLFYLLRNKKKWDMLKVEVLATQMCLTLCDLMDCGPHGSSVHGISPDKNTGLESHSFLQGIFWPRERTWVSCTEGRFFMIWVTREAHYN